MSQALLERPVSRNMGPAASLSSRTKSRLTLGVLVTLVGVAVNLAVFRGLNDTTTVLQLARDVPAGEQVTAADFQTVSIGADGGFRAVDASELASISGSYAKVRMVAGTLLSRESLQQGPLVAPGAAVVAVVVSSGEVPSGLRERSSVQLVLTDQGGQAAVVPAVTVGLPTPSEASSGQVSVSLEMAVADSARVAAADGVRLVLLESEGDR